MNHKSIFINSEYFRHNTVVLSFAFLCLLLFIQFIVPASSIVHTMPEINIQRISNTRTILPTSSRNQFSGLSYQTKSHFFETRVKSAVGYDAKAQIAREYIESSRYAGKSRLHRMFNNFEDGSLVDFNDPGVIKLIKKMATDNPKVVAGASRELVYYQKLYNTPELFSSVKVGTPVPTDRGGISDMDVTYIDRITGRRVWLEVKNNRHLVMDARLKAQMERMGSFKERKVLVCRGSVSPKVKQFAKHLNIEVIENVSSKELVSSVASKNIQAMKISGGMTIAGGVLLSGFSVYSAYNRLDAADWIVDDPLRRGLTSDALLTGAGIATTSKGAIQLRQALDIAKRAQTGSAKGAVSKISIAGGKAGWLGPAGWIFLVAYACNEGYLIYVGDIDPRTGTIHLSGLAGATAASISAAKTGALIGSFLGPKGTILGGFIGGTIGGISGYFCGNTLGELWYEHFVFSNEEFVKQKLDFLEASLH